MRIASIALALSLLAPAASAQTLGIAGLNDFTVNGSIPGSTSCSTVITSSPLTFFVSGAPASTAAALFLDPCTCSTGLVAFPSSCHALGFTALDVGICGIVTAPLTPLGGGAFGLGPIPVPPGLRFSVQAVLINTTCLPPYLFTQAYDVGTV